MKQPKDVLSSYSRWFLLFYTSISIKNRYAPETVKRVEKYITRLGIHQQIVHNNGTVFFSNDFVHRKHEFRITLKPRILYSPLKKGKVEVQNKNLANHLRSFINDTGSNWVSPTNKFAFAHKTAMNYSTGYTPYEIIFGIKPQIPVSLKLTT